jgi:hypothetical protein
VRTGNTEAPAEVLRDRYAPTGGGLGSGQTYAGGSVGGSQNVGGAGWAGVGGAGGLAFGSIDAEDGELYGGGGGGAWVTVTGGGEVDTRDNKAGDGAQGVVVVTVW